MQITASLPVDRFDELLRRLPADLDLDVLARQTKAIERKREIDSGASLLRLALARGPGGLSLSQTAAWGTMLGLAEMSDPGVKYRLDKAVEFLEAVMVRQLADRAPGAAVRWAGRILRLGDGSCFREPGAKTTSWRLHAVYDLGRGGFSHLELTDKHGAESIGRGAPVAGEIRIGDRGFARAPSLHCFRQQSDNKADFIARVGWAAFSLMGQDGADFDLIAHLGQLPAGMAPQEAGQLGEDGRERFFLKKEAKTFFPSASHSPWRVRSQTEKVFWFFFAKKNCFLSFTRLPCHRR